MIKFVFNKSKLSKKQKFKEAFIVELRDELGMDFCIYCENDKLKCIPLNFSLKWRALIFTDIILFLICLPAIPSFLGKGLFIPVLTLLAFLSVAIWWNISEYKKDKKVIEAYL